MKAIVAGCWLVGMTAIAPLLQFPVQAQIIPDATLPVNSSVIPGCTTCIINGGTERGVNLFHSFREFSIPTGGGAWFNNAPQIQNILTRVTGTSTSNIDGLIRANGTANLFLLNPNGIVSGQNARLQIGGSFFASTANSFQFADGSEFSATNPQAPPLLTVNLALGLQSGSITSGTIINRGNLTAGQDLILEANQLDLQGQLVAGRDLTLKAQDTVQIRDTITTPFVAVAGRGLLVQGNQSVDIFALNHPASELVSGGNMTLRSEKPVGGDAHYWSGGNFQIQQLNGELGTLVSPDDPIIRSQGDVTFQDYQGSSLHILAGGRVTAGAVVIIGNDAIADTINPTATPTLATVPLSSGEQITINGNARPTLDIRAGMNPAEIGTPLGTSGYTLSASEVFGTYSLPFIFPSTPPDNDLTVTGSDITIDFISIAQPNGQVLLTNQFRPNLALPDGNIAFPAPVRYKLKAQTLALYYSARTSSDRKPLYYSQ
ncbi:filamentous hemagglutinin N-terminal domain-containing protein [Phormidium sp. CLA17]|uniref:filamentous hemagglutinin N-terminal domain-containing protein n=1 Tax=Leptolyngbya sp. Cla-17 TaxID=2803751 RepID=UPI001490EBE6|nr:filamentous hemagglutinin N-terminal domain-containing protein [Leptolyngbya sp. Cla-17]MBM0740549.1 filamentous hemagglutinin N-terminal domain-containing protein [Leptolyngbya sp. Cla-17]